MKKKMTMYDVFENPKYRGKHIILFAGKVYAVKTGQEAAVILKRLDRTDPNIIPEVAYIPDARSLIFASTYLREVAYFDSERLHP